MKMSFTSDGIACWEPEVPFLCPWCLCDLSFRTTFDIRLDEERRLAAQQMLDEDKEVMNHFRTHTSDPDELTRVLLGHLPQKRRNFLN